MARSQQDIQRDMRRSLAGNEAGLVLYAPMYEAAGHVAFDHTHTASHHGWLRRVSSTTPSRVIASDIPVNDARQRNEVVSYFQLPSPEQVSMTTNGAQIIVVVGDAVTDFLGPQISHKGVAMNLFSLEDGTSMQGSTFSNVLEAPFATSIDSGMIWFSTDSVKLTCSPIFVQRRIKNHLPSSPLPPLPQLSVTLLRMCCREPQTIPEDVLVVPMQTEASERCLLQLFLLLKEHFRCVQSSNARKSTNWREEHSCVVVLEGLHILSSHVDIISRVKLHPTSLGLVVASGNAATDVTEEPSNEGSSLGAKLSQLLCEILDDVASGVPAPVQLLAGDILRRCVPLFYPTPDLKIALLTKLLSGPTCARASKLAMLNGLVENIATLAAIAGLVNYYPTREAAHENILLLSQQLLAKCLRDTISAAEALNPSSPNEDDCLTPLVNCKVFSTALSTMQLFLFSGMADLTSVATSVPVDDMFSVMRSDVKRCALATDTSVSFFSSLVAAAQRVFESLTVAARHTNFDGKAILQKALVKSFVGNVFHNAVCAVPFFTSDTHCKEILQKLDDVRQSLISLASWLSVPLTVDVSALWEQEAIGLPDYEPSVLDSLYHSLSAALAWVAVFLTSAGRNREVKSEYISHPLLQGGYVENPQELSEAQRVALRNSQSEPTAPAIDKVTKAAIAAVQYLAGSPCPLAEQVVRGFRTRFASIRSELSPGEFELRAEQAVERARFLMHFVSPVSPCGTDEVLSCHLSALPFPTTPKARWHEAFRRYRLLQRLRFRVHAASNETRCKHLDMVLPFVFSFVESSAPPLSDLRSEFVDAKATGEMKARGLEFLHRQLSSSESPRATLVETFGIYARGACGRDKCLSAVGAGNVINSCIRSSTYGIARSFLSATKSAALEEVSDGLLFVQMMDCSWEAADFTFLGSIGVARTLFRHCTIFDSEGMLKNEPVAGRARRSAYRDRTKKVGTNDNPTKPEKRSVEEELASRCWETLRCLAKRAVTIGLLATHPCSLEHAGACSFLDDVFSAIAAELRPCAEYIQHLFYSAVERVTEQARCLCSFVCSLLHCFPLERSAALCRCGPLGDCARLLLQFTWMNLPAPASCLAELAAHFFYHYLPRVAPDTLRTFMPFEPTEKFDVSIVECLFRLATGRCVATVSEPVTSSISLTAIDTLMHLLYDCKCWSERLVKAVSVILSETDTFVAPEQNTEEKRETAVSLLCAYEAIAGFPSRNLKVGSTVKIVADAELGQLSDYVIVEMSGTTAVLIDADLVDFQREREVPQENLWSSSHEPLLRPDVAVRLIPLVARSLNTLLENWLSVSSSVLGSCIVATAVRFLHHAAAEPRLCSAILDVGILRKVYGVLGVRLVVQPQPLPVLEELSSIVLSEHLRHDPSIASPPLSSLAQLAERMELEMAPLRRKECSWRLSGVAAGVLKQSCLVFTHPKGKVVFRATNSKAILSSARNFTLEIVVNLRDKGPCSLGSGIGGSVPSFWGKPKNSSHSFVQLVDEQGSTIASFSLMENGVLSFGSPLTDNYATVPLHPREFGRWIHLIAVFDANWCIYRESDLIATKCEEHVELLAQKGVFSIVCGGEANTATNDLNVLMSGLRVWPKSLDAVVLRSFVDALPSDDRLPHIPISAQTNERAILFPLLEGTGAKTSSSDENYVGTLEGPVRWILQRIPLLSVESDMRTVDDVERDAHPELTIPRKEWVQELASLDAAGIALLGLQCFTAMCGHYARKLVVRLLTTAQTDACNVVLLSTGHSSILRQSVEELSEFIDPYFCANLLRYVTDAVEQERGASVVLKALTCALQNQTESEREDDVQRYVSQTLSLLEETHEVFQVEIPYNNIASTEAPLHPLQVMGDGVFSMQFEVTRAMDYLCIFADRAQKVPIAKFPDAKGSWPDVELTHNTWFFVKPTSTTKTTPARFTVKIRSQKFAMGVRILSALLQIAECDVPQLLPHLCSFTVLSALACTASTEVSERRIAALRVLTALLSLWGRHPQVQVHDQSPLYFMFDKLVSFADQQARKEKQQGQMFSCPSQTHSRVVQNIAELAVSAIRVEEQWSGESYRSLCHRRCQMLGRLYLDALVPRDERCCSDAKVSPVALDPRGEVCWKERKCGSWLLCSDKGWRTIVASHGVQRGRWYFEVKILHTNGVCAGAVTSNFRGSDSVAPTSTSPLGQCTHSWSFDGTRLCRIHNGIRHDFSSRVKWKSKDVIGILLDVEDGSISCIHNGKLLGVSYDNLTPPKSAPAVTFFPAVSCNAACCEVNFGGSEFAYEMPPLFLPLDRAALFADGALPFMKFMAAAEIERTLTARLEPPQFMHDFMEEETSYDDSRLGLETVELLAVDGSRE